MNYLLFIELDSKINQPHVLSAPDRDTGVNEAREYRDDIESYDEPTDCLPNLSDVALTFYLPETSKPWFHLDKFTRYEKRGFVYRVVDSCRYRVIRGTSLGTPILPFASYISRFVYIIWNKQKINSPPNELSRNMCSSVSHVDGDS